MATQRPASSQRPASVQEFTLKLPSSKNKKYGVMKFPAPKSVDFATCGAVTLQRENNFRQFKQAHDLETMPRFGAGSEFGREQREEARRKKLGFAARRYSPHSQPWRLKVGAGKQQKKFKATREGSVSEHSSYYVLQRGLDGSSFEAFPVEEWHTFTPEINFRYLNSEEAEEEYSRRAKILNHQHLMVQKRLRETEEEEEASAAKDSDTEKEQAKAKKKRELMLTEMDEWVESDENEEADDEDEPETEELTQAKPKKEKKEGKGKKWKKEARHNSDDEAIEDSDDGDEEGLEMDYDTDLSSEVEDAEEDKYNVGGVEDEEGLKKLNESGSSSEEEEKIEVQDDDDDESPSKKKAKKKADVDSDMSSTSSEGGSDTETVPSASGSSATKDTANNDNSSRKRRVAMEALATESKRPRVESPQTVPPKRCDELTESAVRAYLQFKPMTAKELLKRFRTEKQRLSKQGLQEKFWNILRKIKPQNRKTDGKPVFYLPQS